MLKVGTFGDAELDEVTISCSREDAAQLFMWLNQLNTGFMNDQQYMYFCRFKDQLQEISSAETIDNLRKKLAE